MIQEMVAHGAGVNVVPAGAKVHTNDPTYVNGNMEHLSVDTSGRLRVLADIDFGGDTAGSAAGTDVVQIGVLAESTFPTAVDDGDAVRVFADLYGRLTLRSFDESAAAERTTPLNQAPRSTFSPGAWAALTEAGSTAAIATDGFSQLSIQIVIASINTNVVVRAEGSNDATPTSWFNLDANGGDTTYTGNGTYQLSTGSLSAKWVRLTFVSELGGTAVTVTATPFLGRA